MSRSRCSRDHSEAARSRERGGVEAGSAHDQDLGPGEGVAVARGRHLDLPKPGEGLARDRRDLGGGHDPHGRGR